MTHHLLQKKLHQESNIDDFFSSHLGPVVLERINRSGIYFSTWNQESKELFRTICTYFAEDMPYADQHIRNDVQEKKHVVNLDDRLLLMYFGIANSPIGKRGQFIVLSIPQVQNANTLIEFMLTIAGSTDKEQLSINVSTEDPERRMHTKTFTTENQFKELYITIKYVFENQRHFFRERHKLIGRTPEQTQMAEALNVDKYEDAWEVAANIFIQYWLNAGIPKEKRPVIIQRFSFDNGFRKNAAYRMIVEGYPVEQAYELALNLP